MKLFNISSGLDLAIRVKEMTSILEKVEGCIKVVEYKIEHIKERRKPLLSLIDELECKKKNSVYTILKTMHLVALKRKDLPRAIERLKTFRAIREHLEYSILTLDRADRKIRESYKKLTYI